jgi:crotonobetainyl-CoA:carnitine CoA-transferase CaiB-like acyl-CoA transferase
MAQGHREARPGTLPLADIRVIERSNLLSGRLAGLLLADQGAEVFLERAGPTQAADQHLALDDAFQETPRARWPAQQRFVLGISRAAEEGAEFYIGHVAA